MKRTHRELMLLVMLAGLSGCASLTDSMISCEMSVRNHVLAQKAWGHWSWCYDDLDHSWDFAKGFKEGYRNVLDGGSGCQPTLPPQCYWKAHYQTLNGQAKIHAWFDGFSHGALAAKQDGYGYMGEIPISPTARANMEKANQPRDVAMGYPAGGYPGAVIDSGMSPAGDPGVLLPAPILDGTGQEDGSQKMEPIAPVPQRPYE